MLPDGFHFVRYIEGPGLYLGDRVVATTTPANYDSNPPWRICINPSGLPRYEFREAEEQAVADLAGGTGHGHLQRRGHVGAPRESGVVVCGRR